MAVDPKPTVHPLSCPEKRLQLIADFLNDKTIYLSFVTELELLRYKGISNQEQLR